MDQFIKNGFRLLAVVLGFALMTMTPLLWVVGGAVSGVMGWRFFANLARVSDENDERKEEREERKAARKEERLARRESRRRKREARRGVTAEPSALVPGSVKPDVVASAGEYYSRKEGWNAGALLPAGFSAGVLDGKSREVSINACGIDGLVTARRSGDGAVTFSMPMKNEEMAGRMEEFLRRNPGLKAVMVENPADGRKSLVCGRADVMRNLATEAYHFRDCEVVRKVEHVRQYVIEGCSSFEEAQRVFEANRDQYRPVNSYVGVTTSVDGGEERTVVDGHPLDKVSVVSLPSGAYVLSESSVTCESSYVRIPDDVVEPEDMREFAEKKVTEGRVERRKESAREVRSFDATPEGVARGQQTDSPVVQVGPREFSWCSELATTPGLKAYAFVDSVERLTELSRSGMLPAGTMVEVSTVPPAPRPGGFVVEVPMDDAGKLLKIRPANTGTDVHLSYSKMASDIRSLGSASGSVSGGLPLAGSTVSGHPFGELAERLSNPRLEQMDYKQVRDWMHDASKIEDVTFTIDARHKEMVVSTTVQGTTKTERVALREEDIRRLQQRGEISKVELKDFVMQTHPDFFTTYRRVRSSADVKPSSVYLDPVGDFLAGRKPVRFNIKTAAGKKVREMGESVKESARNLVKPGVKM